MKTQKGITLIALIITIVVMLILVRVTVNIALDGGLFKTAQGVAKNTEAERINETTLSNGTINIDGTGEIDIDDYVAALKGEGGNWELTTDSGTAGLSVGDLVTHKEKTTEQFYVISVTGDTVAMLAGKNITTAGTLEQSNSAPAVLFSNTNYWGSDNELSYPDATTSQYPDLNKYTNKTDTEKTNMGVVSTDAIEIARAYGDSLGVKTGRLMTVEEVVALGGSISDGTTSGCPDFINTTNYWLGSASATNGAWFVAFGDFSWEDYDVSNGCGVRPVVEILKSDI